MNEGGGHRPRARPLGNRHKRTRGTLKPQGIAWDVNGTRYASEFGQDTRDELNVMDAGDNTVCVANLRGQHLTGVPLSDSSPQLEYFAGDYGCLRTATAAPNGMLWVITNKTGGRGLPSPEDDRVIRSNSAD